MKQILVLGAGLSTASLIDYLLKHAENGGWNVVVADAQISVALNKVKDHPRGKAITLDIFNQKLTRELITQSDLVISMLPARFHPMIAAHCLELNRNMLTASYVSREMKKLDHEARSKGLLFLNELGVDPGLDHMSALKIIHQIHEEQGQILGFRSYTGGLIAPESDDNPWHYKFTWNPRNVVLAGQGTASFILDGEVKYIPYNQLYRRTETTSIPGLGNFEVYANRDSLAYREVYGLPDIPTLIRGTLRCPGYCRAWDVLIQLGLTDDSYNLEGIDILSRREFINLFLPAGEIKELEERFCNYLDLDPRGEIMEKLTWLGLFENTPVKVEGGTPAQVLQKILEEKWQFKEKDKDMIVMQHIFDYQAGNKLLKQTANLVVIGMDHEHTAMSITVGTPLAIAARLVMEGVITSTGVRIPNSPDLYEPILQELEHLGIQFREEITEG